MTENKRFTHQRTDDYNFSDILDNGKWVGICHVDCEDDFVNLLNELAEENQELKSKYSEQCIQLDFLKDENRHMRKLVNENEQLKQQVEDLKFELRTIQAYDRTVKEEHSDTVYDFKKKLEKW